MKLKTSSIAACLFSLSPDSEGAIQLFPAGSFDAPRGALRGKGPWQLTADSAQQLISAVSQRQNDILIDYEHQSLLTATNGQPVPAAGWIGATSLEYRESGLFANQVKWTGAASSHIAADEYRYLSPVFSYDVKTGNVLDIISVALTNNPAIDGMQAVTAAASLLATQSPNPTESAMDDDVKEQLLWLLNLPTLATNAEISAELDKLKTLLGAVDAAASLMDVLTAKNTEIAALTTATPDPAVFAPIAALTAMQTENATLKTELAALTAAKNQAAINELITPALADGRLLPAQKEWAEQLGAANMAALRQFLDTAMPIAALTKMQTDGKSLTGIEAPQAAEGIAAAALKYQIDQSAQGNTITTAQAVNHITQGNNNG